MVATPQVAVQPSQTKNNSRSYMSDAVNAELANLSSPPKNGAGGPVQLGLGVDGIYSPSDESYAFAGPIANPKRSDQEVARLRAERVAEMADENRQAALLASSRIADPKSDFVDLLNLDLKNRGLESAMARLLPETGINWFSGSTSRAEFIEAFDSTAKNAAELARFMREGDAKTVGGIPVSSTIRDIISSNQQALTGISWNPSTWERGREIAEDNIAAAQILRGSGIIDSVAYKKLSAHGGMAHSALRPWVISTIGEIPAGKLGLATLATVHGLEAASLVVQIRGMPGGIRDSRVRDKFAQAINLILKTEEVVSNIGLKALRTGQSIPDKVSEELKTGSFVEQAVEFIAKQSNLFDAVKFNIGNDRWTAALLGIKNNSDQGIDFMGRTTTIVNGRKVYDWVPFEVKGSLSSYHTSLSEGKNGQHLGAHKTTESRLILADEAQKGWSKAPFGVSAMAATILAQQGGREFKGYVISSINVGTPQVKTVMYNWIPNAKAPR